MNASQPTVRKYLAWAETEGLLEGPLPEPAALEQRLAGRFPEVTPTQQQSGLTHYTTEIVALREQKVEMAAIRLRLQERHGEVVSYEASQVDTLPGEAGRANLAPWAFRRSHTSVLGSHITKARTRWNATRLR